MGLESGIGSIGSGLFDLYGEDDPYKAAEGYYNKIPGMLNKEYQPWIDAGMGALPYIQGYENRGQQAGQQLQGQYNEMLNDPSGLVNKLGAGFKQSPGYAFQTNQALQAANRASAAGGMAGSPEEQFNIAKTTNDLANQDYYNYLNHSQQLYGQGISGLQGQERLGAGASTALYGTGASAANNLATNLGEAYMNQGNLAFSRTQYNNQRKGNAYGQIWGGINGIFNPGGQFTGGSGWTGGQPQGQQQQGGGGSGGGSSGGMDMQSLGELAGLAMMLF